MSGKYPGRGASRWQYPNEKYTLVESKSPFINVWKTRSTAWVTEHFHVLKLPDELLKIYLPFLTLTLGYLWDSSFVKTQNPWSQCRSPSAMAVISNSNFPGALETLTQINSLLFFVKNTFTPEEKWEIFSLYLYPQSLPYCEHVTLSVILVLTKVHSLFGFFSFYLMSSFYSRTHLKVVAQLCLTLCNPLDHSLQGSSVHGILQAKRLEWEAISFSRGSSQTKDQTLVSYITGRLLTIWAAREYPEPVFSSV